MTDPRDRHLYVGTDTKGGDHIYNTRSETVTVVDGAEITHRRDLAEHNITIDQYVRLVRDNAGELRGWADRQWVADDEDPMEQMVDEIISATANPA